jgi:hypothetical protein
MLTEEDTLVLVGSEEKPGFMIAAMPSATAAAAQRAPEYIALPRARVLMSYRASEKTYTQYAAGKPQ